MFRRHYSDERLLTHLDGEMPGWRRRWLERHLESCWSCRSRRAALEQQIHKVAEAFEEPGFPDDGWAERQIERFRRRQALEAGEMAAPAGRVGSLPWFRPLYVAVAAAAAMAIVVLRVLLPPSPESAVRVVAAATQIESGAAAQPLHQSFRVVLRCEGKQRKVQTGNLEIWSDPSGERYSAQWRNGGRLAFGVWKPKPGEEHWHGAPPPGRGAPLRLASFAARPDSVAGLEELLVRWLASQQWRPVSIAEEVSHFISQSGVTLRAERFQEGGKRILRITGFRRAGGSSAVLTAEFGLSDHRPRLIRLRLEDGGGAAEVLLAAERMERGPEVKFTAGVFEPDRTYVRVGARERAVPPGFTPRPVEPAFSAAPAVPNMPSHEIDEREVEVRYALHRIGTCLGDPIEVEVSANGQVKVRGLADEEPRREAIRQVLRELDYVSVEVRTAAEAMGAAGAATAGEQALAALPPRQLVTGGKVLIKERLVSRLRQSYPEAEIPRRIAGLSNEATAATAGLLAHAWAVRKLHAAFPPARVAQLRPPSRWILEDMLQDHVSAIQEGAGTALRLLEPFLGAAPPPREREATETELAQAVEEFFQLAAQTDRLSRGVFALTQLGAGEESQAASLLIENLARLRRDAAVVRARAAAEFREAARAEALRVAREDASPNPQEK